MQTLRLLSVQRLDTISRNVHGSLRRFSLSGEQPPLVPISDTIGQNWVTWKSFTAIEADKKGKRSVSEMCELRGMVRIHLDQVTHTSFL